MPGKGSTVEDRRAYMREAQRKYKARHKERFDAEIEAARVALREEVAAATFEETPGEEWRPIAGYEGFYEVSDLGRVRSMPRIVVSSSGRHNRMGGFVLNAWVGGPGYPMVGLRQRSHLVHRLVLEAFIGPCPPGQMCRHLNGNRQDARLVNLCWGTQLENEGDKLVHGTRTQGEKHGGAKLTDEAVREIRRLRAEGMLMKDIAAKFGVAHSIVSRVVSRKIWSHVD